MNRTTTLKPVDAVAQQHSEQLRQLILQAIHQSAGFISFERYMNMCLYTPGLGYYSAGSHKLGKGGDFTTAAEISCLFGQTLARHINHIFGQLNQNNILEFGAGSGKMASDIINWLTHHQLSFDHYYIVETSAELKQRQQTLLADSPVHLQDNISWLDQLPASFEGVIFAVEVCDAMPVHLLNFDNGKVTEIGVGEKQGDFCFVHQPVSNDLLIKRAQKIKEVINNACCQTEINLNAPAWLHSLADRLQRGAIFIIDYGYPFSEYYQPARTQGTLRCYYQHQVHDNPLLLPGLQDITAHIDFSQLAETARQAGLDVAAFHSQADFLIAGGITELAALQAKTQPTARWLHHSAALKQLLLPGQMGEQFKVLSLSKNIDPLTLLQSHDRRYQL